jgi:tyramine---L-glutamate ligase
MRLFLYEFVTGGGWMFKHPPPASLLAEARTMIAALAADMLQVPGVEVVVLTDDRWPLPPIPGATLVPSDPPDGNGNLPTVFRVARECDATLAIAPELMGIAYKYVEALERGGVELLSPGAYYQAITGDKFLAYSNLSRSEVPVPRTAEVREDQEPGSLELPPDVDYPVILKQRHGCGSNAVQLLRRSIDEFDWSNCFGNELVIQEYVPGIAASIAFLCGPAGRFPLPACRQRLSDDGRFRYLGGECPLPEALQERAEHISRQALVALLPDVGYVGVDLVLGEADDGSQDYVIEINPRLTTSYIGLRALSNANLAQAMLDAAYGRTPTFDWKPGRVRWSSEGAIEFCGP